MDRLKVTISKETSGTWYKKGESYEVSNFITFDYYGGKACFRTIPYKGGIEVSKCKLEKIPEIFVKEYTVKELESKLGHKFILKS